MGARPAPDGSHQSIRFENKLAILGDGDQSRIPARGTLLLFATQLLPMGNTQCGYHETVNGQKLMQLIGR